MKLTKGKLSKIYNKKKQTMRKLKKKAKRSRRGKTFRKRRPLNLHSKTLKNVLKKGGTTDSGDGNKYQDPKISTVAATEELREVFAENQASIPSDGSNDLTATTGTQSSASQPPPL